METERSLEAASTEPAPYVSRIDTRPLTEKERAVWWVLGILAVCSLLFLFVLMALIHSPMATN